MENRIVKAHVECNKNGLYTVYVDEDMPFGVIGEGHSADEAKNDFLRVFDTMRKLHQERTGVDCQIDFEFVYDASAFLQHYKGMLTLVGLARITGINKNQLSQYVCGVRYPSKRTQNRIKVSVQKFADELSRAMV